MQNQLGSSPYHWNLVVFSVKESKGDDPQFSVGIHPIFTVETKFSGSHACSWGNPVPLLPWSLKFVPGPCLGDFSWSNININYV